MASFAELRNEAKALGIDTHGKPARELEAEIAKKKAAPVEEPKEEKKKMGKKAAAEEKAEKIDGASDVRIAALEEKVEAQAVILRGCLAAMKAMAEEIGFELPKSLAKSVEVAEAVKEEAEEAPAPKKRGRPAKAKEEAAPKAKAAPKKEEEEDEDEDEDDEDEDEVVVDFSITEIEKADLARLQEIAAVINKAEKEVAIEVIDNEKKLRKALLAWLKANAEVVVKDKAPEPAKDEKKASKKKKPADEDEDEDEEDDADEDEDEDDEDGDECPDFCVKGAEIEIGFETDDDETEWCKAKVLKIHKTAADTLVLEGPNKGSEAEVPFDSMRAIKKKLKAGKK